MRGPFLCAREAIRHFLARNGNGGESHIPTARAAQAGEIGSVFAFLASDEASYITGQTIFACGGLTLYPEFRVAWSSGE